MRLRLTFLLISLASLVSAQIRVNVGGPQYTDVNSNVWSADYGCTSASTYTYQGTIQGTNAQPLYQTGRTDPSTVACAYTVPANAYYIVTLKFAEYQTQYANPGNPGQQRIMNIFVNGVRYYNAFNVYQACGFATACDVSPNPIPVATTSNGQISIVITQQQGQPMLSALEIDTLNLPLGFLTLSGIPSVGQVPTATSTTAANWQYGCPANSICDANYATLALGCTAAGTGTLYVTRAWNALATASYSCNMQFLANGLLQPAASATVTLSGSIDAPFTKIFDLSQSSAAILITGKTAPLEVQWFGVKGDNSTNDSVALGYAQATAAASVKELHAGAGTYLICNASYSGTGPVSMFGDGPFLTTFHPYGGAAGCNSGAMISITTTGAVTLHDFGIDGQRTNQTGFLSDNIDISGPGSTNALTPPASVTLYNLYTANAQSVGIQCSPCQNVDYHDSISFQNYFYGASFASSGTTASPTYINNINIHGITSINETLGVALNFFLSNISITGNIFSQSSLGLFQMPHAHAIIEGNVFDGVPTQGCAYDGTCGSISGNFAPIQLEGVSDFIVGNNHIANISGAFAEVYAYGSKLQIPASTGTTLDLPVSHGLIDGVHIDSGSGYSILVSAESNGPSPTAGIDVSIKNTHLENVTACPNLTSVIGGSVSNNTCINSADGGFTLSNDQGVSFRSNYCRNCNTAGGTTYSTGTVSGSATGTAITGSGTTFTSGMVGGRFTVLGTTYQVCARSSNTAITLCSPLLTSPSGASYTLYYGGGGNYPGLTISGTGTFGIQVAQNTFENDAGNSLSYAISDTTTLTPAQSQITYDATNYCSSLNATCAAYSPVPTFTPTLTSCGTGSPTLVAGSSNAAGQFNVGGGTVTSCTLNFAGSGFVSAPACQFTDLGVAVNLTTTGLSSTYWTVSTAAAGSVNIAGNTLQYQCSWQTGQANQGQYPYPYFWR